MQELKKGGESVNRITIRKEPCRLDLNIGQRLLESGLTQVSSLYPEYKVYEDKMIVPENPYWHEVYYVKVGAQPTIIIQSNNRRHKHEEDNYSASIGSCMVLQLNTTL